MGTNSYRKSSDLLKISKSEIVIYYLPRNP
jgi:hypothetical protein